MKKTLALLSVMGALLLTPVAAHSQERLTNGLLGAGAGALVGGPVGAVVGGGIGYTQGGRISRGLGLKGRRDYRHSRRYDNRGYRGRQVRRYERRYEN